MAFIDAPVEFGSGLKRELPTSQHCLDELENIRKDVSNFVAGRSEFFDLDTSHAAPHMSAFGGKADMDQRGADVAC
jgi:hypothetical protein